MEIHWLTSKFEELTPYQLYAILQLRNEVFVVEQNCVFQDADDRDQLSYHFMGFRNEKLLAYTRILPAGLMYEEVSIGRVVTAPSARREGIGRELMEHSIQLAYSLFGVVPIRLGAQQYLKKFYEEFGFRQVSDSYLEDGIAHIYMIK